MPNPAIIYPSTAPQNAPFGADRVVAEGTRYLTESATAAGTVSTELLDKYLFRKIMDTEPTPYKEILTLLFDRAPESVPSLEFAFHESGVSFAPLIVDADVVESAAVAQGTASQVITLDAASMARVGLNMYIGYPTGSYKGTITAINTGASQITVKSHTSALLPALTAGDKLTTGHGELIFDGQNGPRFFRRPTTISRYNYIQNIRSLEKWNLDEEEEWRNMGRTDFMEFKEMKLKRDFQYELAINFLNGKRGQVVSNNGDEYTRTMHGLWPWMQEYGAGFASIPTASMQAVFETFSHNTNYSGNVIWVIGHQEVLQVFSNIYKTQLVRYEPNDMIANLDLDAVKHASRKFVMVPCNALRDQGMFEEQLGNQAFFVDPSLMKPVKFGSKPLIRRLQPSKTAHDGDSNLNYFRMAGYEGSLSFKMGNTDHAFAIHLNDL